MTNRRRSRIAARTAALVVLVAATWGTSCPGPATYVFHRFDVIGSLDSGFTAPRTVTLESGRYSIPAPKRHWWSDEPPRPNCGGFRLYSSHALPRLTHEQTQGRGDAIPPYEFEVRVNPAPRPDHPYSFPHGARSTRLFATLKKPSSADCSFCARFRPCW